VSSTAPERMAQRLGKCYFGGCLLMRSLIVPPSPAQ
jgi:hypothetical protein